MTVNTRINSFLKKGNSALFLLMVFMLPLNMFLNNLFLTVFICLFGIYTILNFNRNSYLVLKENVFLLLALNIPVIILLIGLTYSPETKQGLKELGRLTPVLFIMLYAIINRPFFLGLIKPSLYALMLGCVVSATICWTDSIIEIIKNNESVSALFSSEYAYHNLSDRIGIHTPYLALFVNTSIGFCVYSLYDKNRRLSKIILVFIILFLSIFLFNLMARNAIFCFILF
jgi:hypothetical protein